MKKVLFVSSLGGHLEQLLRLNIAMGNYSSYILTEKNASTLRLKETRDNMYFLPYISRSNFLNFASSFFVIFLRSIKIFRKINPDVIVSTGAGCVLPTFVLGKIFGKKLIFIETFSRVESRTLTGKICYKISDVFIVQWPELIKLYPKAIYMGSIY